MAIIHKATLLPGKLDLLREHLKNDDALFAHVGDDLRQLGSYRFDDPAGHVGIETHVLTSASGAVLQIPVVYRNEAFEGAEDAFLGTMEHSVLGTRWVYDACVDPIYAGELLRTILTGGSEVAEMIETPDGQVSRDPTVNVRGSGSGDSSPHVVAVSVERSGTDVHIATGEHVIVVPRVLSEGDAPAELHLRGSWADRDGDITLAQLAN